MLNYKSTLRKMLQDPFSPEIEKLQKEKEKLRVAVNTIGKDYYRVGEDAKEFERNAINYLAVIEHVVPYYSAEASSQKKSGFYFINPQKIREQSQNNGLLVERACPQPEESISLIEKVVDEQIADLEDFGHIKGFKERKTGLIKDFVKFRKRIKTPYKPGKNYEAVRKGLSETVKGMYSLEKEYDSVIEDLETKKYLRMTKTGIAAVATIAASILLSAELKKVKALKIIASILK